MKYSDYIKHINKKLDAMDKLKRDYHLKNANEVNMGI